MSETPSKRRRRGREAFIPGEDPYQYTPYKTGWGAAMHTQDFVEGWWEAEANYEEVQSMSDLEHFPITHGHSRQQRSS